ncbi:MAG TPA: hypothetical protein VK638_51035, partial [Edaphobacter sp.]|nr:hypothetical protein [Edaphobacter sp.]
CYRMGKMRQQRQSAEKLFGDALDIEPGARRAFLDAACRDEPELKYLVEQLLMEDERAGSFLKKPLLDLSTKTGITAPGVSTDTTAASARFKAGDMIAGRFLVVRFIARGGMGEVYEVEDHLLNRNRVALKMSFRRSQRMPRHPIDSCKRSSWPGRSITRICVRFTKSSVATKLHPHSCS